MASLLFSTGGAAIGAMFGPIGAVLGRVAGAVIGNAIDQALLGGGGGRTVEGPRLTDLDVMTASEGAPIPRVYGRARLSGQVIWATDLEEVVSSRTEDAGGKGGGGQSTTETTYSYYANFAVGLCEGRIGRVARIWADGQPLDLSNLTIRVHAGTEDQQPDPLIVAKQGAANAPAYRGVAYVVFERLPLAGFGNRIPQLAFEIVRPVGKLEQMVRAVTLIPGTTEFGYEPATVVQVLGWGEAAPENRHVATADSDVRAALDDLQAICPNLERVALVVAWFGTDLRAGHCAVMPRVDSHSKRTHGGEWHVAGLHRNEARLVSTVDGRPAYGGTPSDESVRNLIAELKARGLKVTLYPFVMMDVPPGNGRPDPWTGAASQPAYPWRGRITCDPAPGRPGSPDGTAQAAAQIDAFFAGEAEGGWNYRRMVLHYAGLAAQAGGVDAFVIGSELRGLTRVRGAGGTYPAVAHLIALAADVRAMLGSGTTITYAADWTEYGAHVVDAAAQEVRFPLDPLWASSAIDVVGIDYYAPLADWRDGAAHFDRALVETIYDRAYLAGNLRRGEAYDWHYPDAAARLAQARTPITDALGKPWIFRAKDLWNWWSEPHVERVGGAELAAPTAWQPRSKPIWLTELGCPAVDKGANQPSVFPDPKSSESGLPHFSSGDRDDLIQRRLCEAVLAAFDPAHGASETDNPVSPLSGKRMVDPSAIHLWTWDARPYPVFPAARDVWSDGPNWDTGHWLTGRLGGAPLAELVATILADAGISDCDAGALGEGPDGYVIDRPMPPRDAIEPLMRAYAFDAVEEGALLRFRPRGGAPVLELAEDDLVLGDGPSARLVRAQETELPREVTIGFVDGESDYRRTAVAARRLDGDARRVAHADLAVVTHAGAATRRAEIWLHDLWAGRETATFALPWSRLALMPGDVVAVTFAGRRRLFEIQEIVDGEARRVSARAIDPAIFARPLPAAPRRPPDIPPPQAPVHALLLDLPALADAEPPVLMHLACTATPWPGAVAVWRADEQASYRRLATAFAPAIVGETLAPLPRGPVHRWDTANRILVKLAAGLLAARTDDAVLAGANAAALRTPEGAWEVIQFARAELVAPDTWELSRLLRGQAGSEWAIADLLPAGAPFVVLDRYLVPVARGLDALGRPLALRLVGTGRDHGDASAVDIEGTPGPTALRPLAPVHLSARRTPAGVAITWIRRTRRDGDSWEAAEVPLGEADERYEVDILDGEAVVRTLASTTPSVLYAAADELADFGAPQTALVLRVCQISAAVGRGFAATRAVPIA